MSLTFKYKRVKRAGNVEIKSPSIPITVWGVGQRFEFIALLDSGADLSVIPKDVAELLGLKLSGQKEEARGIGGKVDAVQTTMNIELGKPHEKYTLTNIPVKVIFNHMDQEIPLILGRAGFFDKLIISFNQKEEKII